MSDAAAQFDHIALIHVLCWIHEGRHLKKLNPTLTSIANSYRCFLEKFWDFYKELNEDNVENSPEDARRLEQEFDCLFATKTGYGDLDERIQRIANNKCDKKR